MESYQLKIENILSYEIVGSDCMELIISGTTKIVLSEIYITGSGNNPYIGCDMNLCIDDELLDTKIDFTQEVGLYIDELIMESSLDVWIKYEETKFEKWRYM